MIRGLELDEILKIISKNASFEESSAFICDLKIDYNPLVIKRNLELTKEALALLKKEIKPQFHGIKNVTELLLKAKRGSILMAFELKDILVFHNHCARISKFFSQIEDLDVLKDYTDALDLDLHTYQLIDKVVDQNGKMKKDASLKLKELYDKEDALHQSIQSRAQNFLKEHDASLQEAATYRRNDRITFLLKNSDKYKFDGYVHGSSASNQASYVEPKEFVELNNQMEWIKEDLDQEMMKILESATALVAGSSDKYLHNFETLIYLDMIFAKAKYGYDHDGVLANTTYESKLILKDIAHPLISLEKVVRNDYALVDPYMGILITGSNTGGKTVSLKVLALSVLMTYLGIPLIAKEATIPFYDAVYVDIDDNQSIMNSLSTFSSHLSNLNQILKKATKKSFVLIDELASGTDPKEAEAFSMAIVNKIIEIGSHFILTTHFEDLKNFAFHHPKILVSSVSFDQEKLIPTYRYIENSLGSSNALEIAKRYIDDLDVIEDAYHFLDEKATAEEKRLKELEKKILENDLLQEELKKKNADINHLKNTYEQKLENFNLEKMRMKEEYRLELEEYLADQKNAALKMISNLEKAGLKKHEALKEVQKLDSLKIEKEEIIQDDHFEVGDSVRLMGNESIATIEEIRGNQAVIGLNGLHIKTELKKLTKMPKMTIKAEYKEKTKAKRVSGELVLVGKRVEEAMILLEKYIDDAYAAKMSTVKIVHGIGTGALRDACRNYLKKLKIVKQYHNGDYHDGGSAVTIVEF